MTDVHLNFLEEDRIESFCHAVRAHEPDTILITGDISEAPAIEAHLATLERILARPIHFVLGNHDYYRGGIGPVRAAMRSLSARTPYLRWLGAVGVVPLGAKTALVGHDGWADGRLGDWNGSRVMLNDYLHIDELACLSKRDRLARLNALGDEAADHFRSILPEALGRFEHVIVATHVPPFEGACWHEGKISDPDWLPHFSCRAVGEALVEAMRAHPRRTMSVYCGHSHGEGTFEALPNLVVHTGGAEYGAPIVQRLITWT